VNAVRRWFGTDGIRAPFGQAPLDEPTVRALGLALGARLDHRQGARARVVLGGDTRASTPVLMRWLASALVHQGVDLCLAGMLPTPGIAWLTRDLGADAGLVVSASHNPSSDNGIKLLDGRGFKWRIEDEAALETAMLQQLEAPPPSAQPAPPPPLGRQVIDGYLASLVASVGASDARENGAHQAPLGQLRIALDTANGAASPFAAKIFRRLGAQVRASADRPDGSNINRDCGSTHPQAIAAFTRTSGADLGFAFDGDADRVLVADETGTVHDGDAMLYLLARDLDACGQLPSHAVVATSMSNLGLEIALRREGIALVRCDVGDRAVVETLRARGLRLGGEQSGHLVDLVLSTTGDGMLTALRLAALRARTAQPLSTMLRDFERLPQLIENVRVASKPDWTRLASVERARREVCAALGQEGRLVLRYSGTEPLARIMIEGRERTTIEALAGHLAAAIRAAIG